MDDSTVVDVNEYEKIIQKLENDVREHIKVQQQLKLHIDSIQNKVEDNDKMKGNNRNHYE